MSGTPASQETNHENPCGENMLPVLNGKCGPHDNNAVFLLSKEKDNKDRMKIFSASLQAIKAARFTGQGTLFIHGRLEPIPLG